MARGLKPTQKEISSFYEELRRTPLNRCVTINSKRFHPFLTEEECFMARSSAMLRPSMVLLARMAHKTTKEEFSSYIMFGELPPMKLSPQEMEVLQGGL